MWKRQIVKLQQVTGSSHAQDRCNLCRFCRLYRLCRLCRLCSLCSFVYSLAPTRCTRSLALSLPLISSSRARVAACGVAASRREKKQNERVWKRARRKHDRPLCSTSLEKPTKFLKRLVDSSFAYSIVSIMGMPRFRRVVSLVWSNVRVSLL